MALTNREINLATSTYRDKGTIYIDLNCKISTIDTVNTVCVVESSKFSTVEAFIIGIKRRCGNIENECNIA